MAVNDMVTLVAFLGCLAVVQGYPRGPPLSVCESMTPEKFFHGDAQTTASPYTVTTSKSTYMPDETITVTLSSRDNSTFKGVFVQARLKSGASTNPQGTFVLNNGESQLRLLNCGNTANSAVSHNSRDSKTTKTITWKAPSASVGDIHFMVTFIKERTTFWEGVMSADVRASTDITTTTTTTMRPTTTTTTTTMRPTTTTTTMRPTTTTTTMRPTTTTTTTTMRPTTTTTTTTMRPTATTTTTTIRPTTTTTTTTMRPITTTTTMRPTTTTMRPTTTTTTMKSTTTTTTMEPTIIIRATTATTALSKRPESTTTKTTTTNRLNTTSIRMIMGGSNALVIQGIIVWSSIAVTRLLHMMF